MFQLPDWLKTKLMSMEFYTSYYARDKALREHGITPIAISGKPPAFYHGLRDSRLAPSWSIYSEYKDGKIDEKGYEKRFREEVLSKVNAAFLVTELEDFTNGKPVAFLCYEKPSDFCHRQIVASWLNEELGIQVKEWTAPPK